MEYLLALTLFAFSAGITPGPNNIMLMSSALNFGIKRTIPHMLGICLGFPAMVLAVGLGLGELFEHYPMIHIIIKYLGIIYLLYLSWMIANSSSKMENNRAAKPFNFFQAAAYQWVNPKGWIMAIGAIATYTSVEQEVTGQIFTISSVFLMVAFPCTLAWMAFGAGLKHLLSNPRQQKIFNISMALLLVISIIPMLNP